MAKPRCRRLIVSLLSRNKLTIVLRPGQIGLQRSARKFTLRGSKLELLGQQIIAAETDGEAPWSGSLAALARALPGFVWKDMQATVVLSNHFVQYVLVPWCG